MKKIALVAMLACLAGEAMAANPPQPIPSGKADSYTGGLAFYGATVFRVETSTPTATPILLGSGPGVLLGAQCIGSGAGDFGVPFDSNQTAGLTATTQGEALGGPVPSQTSQASATTQAALAPWVPAGGSARFSNGLAFIKSNASALSCYVYALFDSVTSGTSH